MPSRGFYEVANVEEGKVAHRDQSYRSCVLTLIIFLFLCIVLIVVGLLLRKSHSYHEDEDLRSVEGYRNHYEDRAKGTTSTTESLQYSTHSTVSNETNEIQPKTTTTTIDVTNWTDTSHMFERLENATATAETETSTFSVATTELIITEKTPTSSTTNTELVTDKAETTSPITSSSTSPTTESVIKDEETSTSATTKFVTFEEEKTSPITTESAINADETSTSSTTKFIIDEETNTSPITTESVIDAEETSTSATTKFVIDEEETLTTPITTQSVIDAEETSTSATTKFIIDEEANTSPITTESVIDAEETSTSATTKFVIDEEETLTSPITTESVINADETSTSTTTKFVTDKEEKTSPITTESVIDAEETSTSATTKFVIDEEETLTSPITTESVINADETSTSATTKFIIDEEANTSPITTESVIDAEETLTSTTTKFVTEKEETTSPITTESIINAEETSTSTTTKFVTDEEEKTSPITTEYVIKDEETSTSPTTKFVTEKEETTSPITSESVTVDEGTSTSSTITTELATNKVEESTVETSTTTESTTEISRVTTEKSEDVTHLESSTTSDSEFSTETSLSTTAAAAITASTTGSEEETAVSSTTDSVQSTTTHSAIIVQSRMSPSTFDYENETEVCTTGECKNLASKMLFYMNHAVDPCDDFYEYACGGFEANPRIGEVGFESEAYNRILRQLRQEIREEKSSLFTTYYDSCMRYETLILKEKIGAAKKALINVGKFYTTDNLDKDHKNFTGLVARLLLHNSALLFDVSPELDESHPIHFTLKIGPTTYKSPFEVDGTEDDPCYASQFERDQETVDLEKLYKEYKSCKNNTKELLSSIGEAMSTLGAFDELKNNYNISQHMNTTVINIDFEIVQKFFANFPSKDQIRKAYLMKEYSNISITELQRNSKIINWTQLVEYLTQQTIAPEVYVQVYFYDALIKGLKNLEEFGARSPIELNNALLGLYAQTLYQQLILPKHVDPKDYCLRVATNLLTPEASNLYISTFSKHELVYMNDTIHRLFEELKETLKLKVEQTEWTKEDRVRLVAKVDSLKVVTPDISYFGHNESVYSSMQADKLTDNYFDNSITLMKRYRKRMYTQFRYSPGDPEQIWTYYTTPFQSKGLVVYELNLVVIPFGAIDWSVQYDKPSFDYITLATIGTTIAHQIAHHFDANGIFYQSGSRHNTQVFDSSVANSTFEGYIRCQDNVIYDNPLTMTLPSTGQTVSYEISQLTLNERLSETVGLGLAYDTLDRLRSSEEVHLPWLDLDSNQLFYLTYAQMHCTKLPLTSSYVSLYEDEQLPSRIRIFVSASNNRLLGEAWKCPDGSGIFPSYSCDVFPYLHIEESWPIS